ncbi:MAG TPA: PAS domain-containing protein [Rhizomicrobium sp.]|nr:PAS domain-containing protein [Rhizomicrobium sp.]
MSEVRLAPPFQAETPSGKPWLDALRTAQSTAANAHAQTMFWQHLREMTFTRKIDLHPKLIALFSLWSAKCDGEKLPARELFTIAELRPWLGHLALLEPLGSDYHFHLSGTELIARFGGEATGRMLGSCRAEHATLRAALNEACQTRAPVPAVSAIEANGETAIWNEIVLPLSNDGKHVSRLLVGSYPFQAPPR